MSSHLSSMCGQVNEKSNADCSAFAGIHKPEKEFRRRVQSNGSKTQTLYSQAKVKEATNNFEKKIGHGGFGDVFYGKLADGQEIAAKVLSNNSYHMLQEFYNEVYTQ